MAIGAPKMAIGAPKMAIRASNPPKYICCFPSLLLPLAVASSSAIFSAHRNKSGIFGLLQFKSGCRNKSGIFGLLQFKSGCRIPIIGGKSLDLHRLFIEVTSRGGIEKIVSDRRWKEVMAVFKFGPTITNASFVLRKYYLSLLYHFEQVYYFRKKTPTIIPADTTNRLSDGSGSVKNLFSGRRMVEVGGQVTGTIDKRFDHGYVVTVDMGSEKLSGFLYHLPSDSPAPSHGTHNMYQLALREPSPEPDPSGYDVFFTEHYIRLKPLYHGQENVIRKRIQVLWSTLTEEEKQVYQEKGSRGKER